MKSNRIVKVASVIFVFFASLSACKKKESEKQTSSPFLSATLSVGGAFSSTGSAVQTNKNNAYPHPYVEVKGTGASGEFLFVWIYSYTGALGTFAMGSTSYGGVYKAPSASTGSPSVYGTLTITSVTPDLTGSFSFTCADSTHVSGTFSSSAP